MYSTLQIGSGFQAVGITSCPTSKNVLVTANLKKRFKYFNNITKKDRLKNTIFFMY